MARRSKLETDRIINEVCEWMISGIPDYKIILRLQENYGIKNRQCRNYIKKADDKLKPKYDAEIESKRQRKILEIQKRVLMLNAQEAKTAKGLTAFINAQKLLVKLMDLEPTKKMKFENDEENPFVITWKEEKTYANDEEPEDDK